MSAPGVTLEPTMSTNAPLTAIWSLQRLGQLVTSCSTCDGASSHQSRQSSSSPLPSSQSVSRRSSGMDPGVCVATRWGTATLCGGNGSAATGWTSRRTLNVVSCRSGTSWMDPR